MSNKSYTDRLVMVEPIAFRFNDQTATNNYYQKVLEGMSPDKAQTGALEEFQTFVKKIESIGVKVHVIKDTKEPDTPDSIFPNNWVSFHENGSVALYPMFAPNRRAERRMDLIDGLKSKGARVSHIVDMSEAEDDHLFLEGTGSIVLDRKEKIAYAALSIRTDLDLFVEFCKHFGYTPVSFTAYQDVAGERKPIYHTNVMMCVAETFVVICLDCIDDLDERHELIDAIEESGKEIIEISEEQVEQFAGNMLQVGKEDAPHLIMSKAAFESLDEEQIKRIEVHCPILHSSLDTIEACGGGSARCMMAEDFLPYTEN